MTAIKKPMQFDTSAAIRALDATHQSMSRKARRPPMITAFQADQAAGQQRDQQVLEHDYIFCCHGFLCSKFRIQISAIRDSPT
jgi:hypothetical protein